MSEPSRSAIEQLIGSLTLADFLREKYEIAPFVCRIEDDALLTSLPALEDVDRILWQAKGELRDFVALFKDNVQLNPSRATSGSAFRQWVADEFNNGATIVIRRMHDVHHGSALFARRLGQQCDADVTVNAYVSPPKSQGFGVHYDAHNIFVVQLAGEKHWRTHGQADVKNPTRDLVETLDSSTDLAAPTSHRLATGHVLYLPRGEVHQASTNDDISFHLSIGVHPPSIAEVLHEMAELAAERDAEFRELPYLGSVNPTLRLALKNLLSTLLARIDTDLEYEFLQAALTRRARKRVRGMDSLFDPEASRFASLPPICAETRLRRWSGMECSVREFEDCMDVTFPGLGTREHPASLQAPLRCGDALRFIARAKGGFTPAELPGGMPISQAIALVQRLAELGLLRPDRMSTSESQPA